MASSPSLPAVPAHEAPESGDGGHGVPGGLAVLVAVAAAACLVLHESAAQPLPMVGLPAAGELLLVVGPEGGITDVELATLTAAGGRPVRLGRGVLRSSSAGAVALGAIGALSQRWS